MIRLATILLFLPALVFAAPPRNWAGKKLPPLTYERWVTFSDTRPGLGAASQEVQTPQLLATPGHVTVVVVSGGSWCGPCVQAVGEMPKLFASRAPSGVRFVVLFAGAVGQSEDFNRVDAAELANKAGGFGSVRLAYGDAVEKWLEGEVGHMNVPRLLVLAKTGEVVLDQTGWSAQHKATLEQTLDRIAAPRKGNAGGLPDAVTRGRARLLKHATDDEAALTIPEDPAARKALLERAITLLASDVAALDAANGGMPPAEILRFGCHYRNALDRARAGAEAAFAPLPEDLSPLSVDRLERRILLFAGLSPADRARLLPKLKLAKKLVVTLSGNRRKEITVIHSGSRIDPDPKDADLDTFWTALASPEIRQGWFTGHDLRNAYISGYQDLPATERYDGFQLNRLKALTAIFEPRFLYDEEPPRLMPGDLLDNALPWKSTTSVIVVRSADSPERLEAQVDVIDLDSPGANLGVPSSRPFPLSLEPATAKKRYIRPGLLWLRPRVTEGLDVKSLLRPFAFPQRDFPWRPMPAQEALRTSNAGIEPDALVRLFLERAGGGFYFGGMPLDEREALTTWTKSPQVPERLLLSKGYEIVANANASDTERSYTIVYLGALTMLSPNGARFDGNEKSTSLNVRVVKTEDGWKIAEPAAPPAVLLVDRSRLTPVLADAAAENLGAVGRALYNEKRFEESARKYEAAAAIDTKDGGAAYDAACSWALAGQPDAALRWLGTAADRGFGDVEHIREDEDLDTLRAKSEFQALMKRVEANAD